MLEGVKTTCLIFYITNRILGCGKVVERLLGIMCSPSGYCLVCDRVTGSENAQVFRIINEGLPDLGLLAPEGVSSSRFRTPFTVVRGTFKLRLIWVGAAPS